jgi:SAM-dependent methyltransferase
MSQPRGPAASLMSALHRPIYRARLRALTGLILPHLCPGDRVLDVGCGFGELGAALMAHPGCPSRVAVEGLERVKRGGEKIPVAEYDGRTIPFADGAYHAVILADVLHHEPDPDRLLAECARVASRVVLLKDHARNGLLAQQRISLIDWAANAPYGVPCLYRYNSVDEWRAVAARHGLRTAGERTSINLYPPVVNALVGRSLQYFAALEKPTPPTPANAPEEAAP